MTPLENLASIILLCASVCIMGLGWLRECNRSSRWRSLAIRLSREAECLRDDIDAMALRKWRR